MLSPSLEDYLEEVYRLSIKKEEIRITDIAQCLNFSMPSVVKGLKKLHKLGYIKYKPYEKIEVLEKGKKRGKFLVDRNKILMEFVEIIGSKADKKEEAEAMEHYLSISTIKSIEKLIEFFKTKEDIFRNFKDFNIESRLKENEIEEE